MKFYRMLDQIIDEGLEPVMSWLPHGRAFKIHNPKVFAATILPRFFNQSKYTSFQRQLNLYGFSRCCHGHDAGAYHHPFFLRGRQSLVKNITRTKAKGNGDKRMKLHEKDPDFYAMGPLDDSLRLFPSHGSYTSAPGLEQPAAPAPLAGCSGLVSQNPPFSPNELCSNNISPRSELISPSSSNTEGSAFMNDLNETIFIHELALGCSILCQLRKDTSV